MYIHLATIVTNKVCEVKLVTTDKEEDAMEYQKNREKRIRIFEDTLYYCERTACLSEAIMRTRKNTVLYRHPLKELNNMDKKRYKQSCEVFVSRNRILKTAGKLCLEYRDDRIGILNFASAVSPGGEVIRGGHTQEECLCRCSTLYPCLNTEELRQAYFDDNRRKGNGLYNDACIFTPGVICIKEDTRWPVLMEQHNWFSVDVISCAEPKVWNASIKRTGLSYEEGVFLDENEWKEMLVKRIQGMLQAAVSNLIDIMVIGIPSYEESSSLSDMEEQVLKKALKEYRHSFKAIVFAIYYPVKEIL